MARSWFMRYGDVKAYSMMSLTRVWPKESPNNMSGMLVSIWCRRARWSRVNKSVLSNEALKVLGMPSKDLSLEGFDVGVIAERRVGGMRPGVSPLGVPYAGSQLAGDVCVSGLASAGSGDKSVGL